MKEDNDTMINPKAYVPYQPPIIAQKKDQKINSLSKNQIQQKKSYVNQSSNWDPVQYWKNKTIKSHKDRIAYLQGNKGVSQFFKISNWGDLVKWHKTNSPWLDDIALKKIVLLYNQQAIQKKQKKLLVESQMWMIQLP